MKRISKSFAIIALVLLIALPMFAQSERVANILIVDNDAWDTDLAVVAPDGEARLRISDCSGFGGVYTVPLSYGDGIFVPDVSRYQCSRTKLGVVKLPILSGVPRLWSQARYQDQHGDVSFVVLPSLPDALPRSYAGTAETFTAEYVFEAIQNDTAANRSTFVALIPDGSGKTQVELTVSSYSNPANAFTETVTIDSFTFHELTTPTEFGRLVVRHVAPPGDDGAEAKLFAVAFIGDRDGGNPRVEVPRTRFAMSIE